MVAIQISETLAAKLETLAKREGLSIEELIEESVTQQHPTETLSAADWHGEELDAFVGSLDIDDVDLSVNARDQFKAILRQKYDDPG